MLEDRERETLGAWLKKERELRNLSLEDVARLTKVKKHFLLALEGDRYETLPSPIYVRGFLSAYAKSIGMDPHEVLIRYEGVLKRGIKEEPVVPMVRNQKKESPRQVFLKERQYWIVFGVMAASLFLSYHLHPFLSGPSLETFYKREENKKTLQPVVIQEAERPSLPSKEEPISIELKAVEKTWVQIRTDGQLKEEILFQPGERSSFQGAHQIEMWIGNAGGLEIVCDGKRLESFGKSGEVIRLVFTRQGVERKEREKETLKSTH